MTTAMTPARVDEEIKRQWALLSDLQALKNSFLPISRLPPEILADIFIFGAHEYFYEERSHCTDCTPYWINVSYVCRRWRGVALNCPTLWAYHFTLSPRWTEELLARSREASLKMRIRFNLDRAALWSREHVEKLLSQMERIEELRLDVPDAALPINLSLSAPRLRILDIGLAHPSLWVPTISDGDTPSLRVVKLTCCMLPLHSLNLSRLTALSLKWIPAPSQQNIVDFLASLSRMNNLKVLHLEDALPSARQFLSSGGFRVSSKIVLPHLARFFVAGPLSAVVALLSCTNFPLKSKVGLEIESEDDTTINDYAQFSSILAQRYSQSEDPLSFCPTFRSLFIHFHDWDTSFVLCALTQEDCCPELSTVYSLQYCNLPLAILVQGEPSNPNGNIDRIAPEICRSIPLERVQTLQVIHPPLWLGFWEEMLRPLHRLRHLKLSRGFMPNLSFLATVSEELVTGFEDSPRHAFVPALDELTLYDIKFAPEGTLSTDSISRYDFLFDALFTREELRSRLTMLECSEARSSRTDGYLSEEI